MTIKQLRNRSWRWLLRSLVLPAGDLVFQQGMMEHLRFLGEAQWWPPERLHAYRNRQLQALLKVAWREVPFYRALLDNARVRPEEIRGPGDLPRVPIVTKAMLRAGYPHLTTRKTGQRTYEASSSGSTGANFYVMEDAYTAGHYRAAFLLVLQWAGWDFGEPHLQTGMTLSRSWDRRFKDSLLRCHYVSAFDLDDDHLDRTLDLLERYEISHLWGYPGSLYYLALRARQKGWNQKLQSVVTWGDNLYPPYRAAIEEAFGVRVFDTYGCGEGIQIAAQCGHGSRYHVHTSEVVVEYLDDDGLPVPAGETANLIVTRLHPGPMPLIRYRIGDLGIDGRPERCPCGRGFDLLASIQGRDTDVVLTPAGNRLIVHFFTGILEHFHEIGCFQVVQKEPAAVLLRVVPADGCRVTPEVSGEIVRRLREKGMQEMRIDLETVPEIPVAPSGKRRFVISEIARNAPRPRVEVSFGA